MHIIPLALADVPAIAARPQSTRNQTSARMVKASPAGEAPLPEKAASKKNEPKFPQSAGRWARRTLAVALVAVALWWLALPMLVPMTNQAVVNARLVQIRAHIDGTPIDFPHDLGDRVEANEKLAGMVNPRADTTTLSNLKSRLGELTARKTSLAQELGQVTKAAAACRETCDSYKSNRIAFLQTVVKQGESALQIAHLQYENAEKDWKRFNDLANRSAAGGNELDKAIEIKAVTRERIMAEQAALAKAKVELEAARKGVYVSLETPSFLARAEELELKMHTLQNAMKETDQYIGVVEQEVEREQRRVEAISEAVAASPVGGVVWKRFGNLGQATKQNEILYEVADTGSIFVEAQLNQRHMSKVVVGSQATMVLTGGEVRKGHVRSVNTLGPADVEPSFAVTIPNRDFKQVRVLIGFDAEQGDAALIGRHVRVILSDPDPTPLQRTVGWIFAAVGS